jgi:hypothetical protein
MAVQRELVEVAQPSLLLTVIKRVALTRALASPPGLAYPLDRLTGEERLVAGVDRLNLEVGLVTGEMQVVVPVDLLAEPLRVPPVFVEVPDGRLLIDVPAGAAQAELGAARGRSGLWCYPRGRGRSSDGMRRHPWVRGLGSAIYQGAATIGPR